MEYIIINENNLENVRKIIEKNKDKTIIVTSKDYDFNRKVLENKKIKVLLFQDFLFAGNNKRLKQRDISFNHILAKIAIQNDIKIGIDIESLTNKEDNKDNLSRLVSLINICNKYNNKIIIINKNNNPNDLFSFLISLGLKTSLAKYALENIIYLE